MFKRCGKCGEEKPLDAFHKRPDSPDGLRNHCKPCRIQNATEWIHNNREQYNARIRASRATDLEKHKTWERNYRERDPERFKEVKNSWAQRQPHLRKAIIRRYHQSHRAEATARTRHRQVSQVQATPEWADLELIKDFYRLAWVWGNALGVKYHVDHIVPVTSRLVCGLHCEANLQILEGTANRRKGNRYWPDMPE